MLRLGFFLLFLSCRFIVSFVLGGVGKKYISIFIFFSLFGFGKIEKHNPFPKTNLHFNSVGIFYSNVGFL